MITITIDDIRLESAALIALAEVLQGAQKPVPGTPALATDTVAPPDATRPRRRNNRIEAAPASDVNSVSDEPSTVDAGADAKTKPETDTQSEPSVDIPTVVELRAKAQEKGTTPENKKAIKALLNEFDSKSISDVPEDQRAAFLVRLDEL